MTWLAQLQKFTEYEVLEFDKDETCPGGIDMSIIDRPG